MENVENPQNKIYEFCVHASLFVVVLKSIWRIAAFGQAVNTKESRGNDLRKVNWVLIMLVLIGFMIGGFIGTYFEGTFLNYGQTFGMNSPVTLDMGFVILTFGIQFHITIASVIGVVISFVLYRFIR